MARHVCPWWIGYLLLSPLRRFAQPPKAVVGPHVGAGDTVLDVGSAMGYFSLPMARMVGGGGRVVSLDLQARMLRTLGRRALKAGLADRVELRECSTSDLGVSDLEGRVDFALLFAVVHEVDGVEGLMIQVHAALRGGGKVLLAEPRGHVNAQAFDREVSAAVSCGLVVDRMVQIRRTRAVLLVKRESDLGTANRPTDHAPGR